MRLRGALTVALLVIAGFFIADGLSAGGGVRDAHLPVGAPTVATVSPVAVVTRRLPQAPDRVLPVGRELLPHSVGVRAQRVG